MNKFLENLLPGDNSLCQIKKKLNKIFTLILPLKVNNVIADTNEDNVDFLAKSYALQFSPNTINLTSSAHLSLVDGTVNNFLATLPDPLSEIQKIVIHNIIKNLKTLKILTISEHSWGEGKVSSEGEEGGGISFDIVTHI